MKNSGRSTLRAFLAAAGTLAAFSAANLSAATLTWNSNTGSGGTPVDGGGIWSSDGQNWGGAADLRWVDGSDARFGYGSGAGGVVTVAGNFTAQSVTFNKSGYELAISSGKQLTIGGNLATSGIVIGGGTDTKISGEGTLRVNSSRIVIGSSVNSTARLDMSGLDNFVYQNLDGTFIVGGALAVKTANSDSLTLAHSSTITASAIIIGKDPTQSYTGSGALKGKMVLGVDTKLNADIIHVGQGVALTPGIAQSALLAHNTAYDSLSPLPVLRIRNSLGVEDGRANVVVGQGAATGVKTEVFGTVNLTNAAKINSDFEAGSLAVGIIGFPPNVLLNSSASVPVYTATAGTVIDAKIGTLSVGLSGADTNTTDAGVLGSLVTWGGVIDAKEFIIGGSPVGSTTAGVGRGFVHLVGGTTHVENIYLVPNRTTTSNQARLSLSAGATLRTKLIQGGMEQASRLLMMYDGTLRNYDPSSDLIVQASSDTFTTGIFYFYNMMHGNSYTINIDSGRTGYLNTMIGVTGTTSFPEWIKAGAGSLVVNSDNTQTINLVRIQIRVKEGLLQAGKNADGIGFKDPFGPGGPEASEVALQTRMITVEKGASMDLYEAESFSAASTKKFELHIAGDGTTIEDAQSGTVLQYGALASSSPNAGTTSVKTIILDDAARITTSRTFELKDVSGTGDLTLSNLAITSSPSPNMSAATPSFVLASGGKIVLSPVVDPDPDDETVIAETPGKLILETLLTATGGNDTIDAAGGVEIRNGGALSITANAGATTLVSANSVVQLNVGGFLALGGNTTQVFTSFSGAGAITHTGDASTATLELNLADDSSITGKIGTTSGGAPVDGNARLNLIKRGTGVLTLGNSASDYMGVTQILGGQVNLTATLDSGTGTGALGATAPLQEEASRLTIDNATLSSSFNGVSSTNRLFTIGASGTARLEANGADGGLRFTNTGNIVTPATSSVLTLAGSYAGGDFAKASLFAPSLTGDITVVKEGAGLWIIGGAGTTSNYTGGTIIKEGTLVLGADNALPGALTLGDTSNTAGTLRLNGHSQEVSSLTTLGTGNNRILNGGTDRGTFVLNNSTDSNLLGSLGIEGGSAAENNFNFIKNGAGRLVVEGALAYNGDTEVRQGVLEFAGTSTLPSSAYTFISAGAQMDTSAMTSAILLSTGKALVAGNDGVAADFIGDYTLAGGTLWIGGERAVTGDGATQVDDLAGKILRVDGDIASASGTTSFIKFTLDGSASSGNNDHLRADNILLSGNVVIDPTLTVGRLEAGSYALFTYDTALGAGSIDNLSYGLSDPRYLISFEDDGAGTVFMNVQNNTGEYQLVWSGENGTQWGDGTPENQSANFQLAGVSFPVAFAAGDNALFDDTVAGDPTKWNIVVADAGVEIGSAVFNNTAVDYTIDGSGAISGSGYLEKQGTGKLIINTSNTYAGGTVLVAGTLELGNDDALGTGDLQLQGGVLQSNGTTRTLANNFVVANNVAINTGNGDIVHTGALSGGGILRKTGSGTLHFSGDGSTFAGTVSHTSGTIQFDANVDHSSARYSLSAGAALTLAGGTAQLGHLEGAVGSIIQGGAGAHTLEVGASNLSGTYAGKIVNGSGTLGLTKTGSGTLVLTDENTYTGATTVDEGMLVVGNGSFAGSIASSSIVINSPGTFVLNRSTDINLAASISGDGTFEKRNNNTLSIATDNSAFTGTLNIVNGTVALNGSGSVGTAQINLSSSSTLEFSRAAANYTVANDITGSGLISKTGTGTLTYTGNNTSTGVMIVYGGTLAIGDGTAGVQQSFNSEMIQLRNNAELVFNTGANATFTLGGGISNIGSVTKTGTGTVVLLGRTTLNGSIHINEGEVRIGNGGTSGSIEGGAEIQIGVDGKLSFNRGGSTVVNGRIVSNGTLQIQGGSIILAKNNQLKGTVVVESGGTLQIGNGGNEGALNTDNSALTVQVDSGGTLAFNRIGSNLVSGANLTITGAGNFEKNGPGVLTFNSNAQYTGDTIVSGGRLIIGVSNLPGSYTNPTGTGYLVANGTGALEIKFDDANTSAAGWSESDPFLLSGRIKGTGTIALGSDSSVTNGATIYYKYAPSASTGALGTLSVELNSHLSLGTNPLAPIKVDNLIIQPGATLVGQGSIQGNLTNNGTFATDGVVGTTNITGNYFNSGNITIDVGLDTGVIVHDTINYAGSVQISDGILYVNLLDSLTVADLQAHGQPINFLVDTNTDSNPLGSSVVGNLKLDPSLAADAFIYNNGDGLSLLFAESILDIPGIAGGLKDGLNEGDSGFVSYLDGTRDYPAGNSTPVEVLGALLSSDNPAQAINNASPLGLASMTSMSISIAQDDAATLRAHLEGLRYNRSSGAEINIAPYFVTNGVFVSNGTGHSDPNFDFDTYGGLVGVDHSFGPQATGGINVGFHKGRATLANGGGRVTLENARITAYGTYQLDDWYYVDASVFGGYNSYDVKHQTVVGEARGKPNGYDGGFSAYFGTILPLSASFHLTPYVGVEYVHSTVDGFTETGTTAALKVDDFDQDSLRAKIGTGMNWLVPTGADYTLRVGLDASFAYEFLDTETEITGAFASDTSGNKFKVKAAASPDYSLRVGPMAEFGFDGNKAIGLSYSMEYDLDSQYIHHVNATFKMRF